MSISSVILAGGSSSRLGKEKHTEVIAGKSLLERTIDQLKPLSNEILIVISTSQSSASFSSYTEARTVVDLYPGKGSLGGIYTGLKHSTSFHALAVACDMPFLNSDLLRYLISLCPAFDVVIPVIDDLVEPLHAIYSKNCLPAIEILLKEGNLKVRGLFDSVKVRYVGKEEIDRFDSTHLSFFNINTREDLENARRLATQAASNVEKAD